MKKLYILTLLLTGCANTHEQVLTDTIANIDTARQSLAPLVTANCMIASEALPVFKPELLKTTKTICDLLNGANEAFKAMPLVTIAPPAK